MAEVRELHEPRRRAQRHADRTRRQADERRSRESGVTGWVADRAGDWSLDEQDWDFIERQKYFWNPLLDYWFRMEVSGWERIPDPPALVVGIHSGAPFPWMPGRSASSGGVTSARTGRSMGPRTT